MRAEDVTLAAQRVLGARFRLGIFDPPAQSPWAGLGAADLGAPEHLALADEVAARGEHLPQRFPDASACLSCSACSSVLLSCAPGPARAPLTWARPSTSRWPTRWLPEVTAVLSNSQMHVLVALDDVRLGGVQRPACGKLASSERMTLFIEPVHLQGSTWPAADRAWQPHAHTWAAHLLRGRSSLALTRAPADGSLSAGSVLLKNDERADGQRALPLDTGTLSKASVQHASRPSDCQACRFASRQAVLPHMTPRLSPDSCPATGTRIPVQPHSLSWLL